MIALPYHGEQCGLGGSGELDRATLQIKCTTVRRWPRGLTEGPNNGGVDSPGCGKVSAVCFKCGVRAIFDGSPCSACATNTDGKLA